MYLERGDRMAFPPPHSLSPFLSFSLCVFLFRLQFWRQDLVIVNLGFAHCLVLLRILRTIIIAISQETV